MKTKKDYRIKYLESLKKNRDVNQDQIQRQINELQGVKKMPDVVVIENGRRRVIPGKVIGRDSPPILTQRYFKRTI